MESYIKAQITAATQLEYRAADNYEEREYNRAIVDYTKAIELCPFSIHAYT